MRGSFLVVVFFSVFSTLKGPQINVWFTSWFPFEFFSDQQTLHRRLYSHSIIPICCACFASLPLCRGWVGLMGWGWVVRICVVTFCVFAIIDLRWILLLSKVHIQFNPYAKSAALSLALSNRGQGLPACLIRWLAARLLLLPHSFRSPSIVNSPYCDDNATMIQLCVGGGEQYRIFMWT